MYSTLRPPFSVNSYQDDAFLISWPTCTLHLLLADSPARLLSKRYAVLRNWIEGGTLLPLDGLARAGMVSSLLRCVLDCSMALKQDSLQCAASMPILIHRP